ncbi:MAG: transglutaminase domain-containing protein [Planctomycetota bacterium]
MNGVRRITPATGAACLLAAAAFAAYQAGGGGWFVPLLAAGGIAVTLWRGHFELKPVLIGPVIALLFAALFLWRPTPLFSDMADAGAMALTGRFLVIVIMPSSLFFLYFRAKTAPGMAVTNCYHLLLVIIVVASGADLPFPPAAALAVYFAGAFLIDRQGIHDRFLAKMAAGREFVSGILAGSAALAYLVFALIAGGAVLAMGVPVYRAATAATPLPAQTEQSKRPAHRVASLRQGQFDPTDTRVVMTVGVRYPGRPLGGLYMKGRDFDRYTADGLWRVTRDDIQCRPDSRGLTLLPRFITRMGPSSVVHQEVRLYLAETREIFALEMPETFRAGDGQACRATYYGGLTFTEDIDIFSDYAVVSRIVPDPEGVMAALTASAFIGGQFMDIPAGLEPAAARGRELAGNNLALRNRVERIREFLTTECTYDMEAVCPADMDPILWLLENRRGICVHFSSAFVIMARGAGIPARYCTGYCAPYPNESAVDDQPDGAVVNRERYILRKRNAHAWAEIFLERAGWVTVECTPPAGVAMLADDNGPSTPLPPKPARDAEGPAAAAAADSGPGMMDRLLDQLPAGAIQVWGLVTGGVLLALAFLLRIPRRRYVALMEQFGLRRPHYTDVGFFNDLMILLRNRGLQWAPGETAAEFLARLPGTIPSADAAFLAEQYHRIRFGAATLTEPARIAALMQTLQRMPPEGGTGSPDQVGQ